MNPACFACKGACCETLVLDLPLDQEVRIWLSLRGRPEGMAQVRIPCACSALGSKGECTIYAARPEPCRVFAVGSPQCIAAIRAQRPKQAAQLIKLARDNQPNNQGDKQ